MISQSVDMVGFSATNFADSASSFLDNLLHQVDQEWGDVRGCKTMIDRHIRHGALRHRGVLRLLWVLDDRNPSTLLHRPEARRAIIERTRQNDSHNAPTIRHSRRPK